jgi:hypothetical protein
MFHCCRVHVLLLSMAGRLLWRKSRVQRLLSDNPSAERLCGGEQLSQRRLQGLSQLNALESDEDCDEVFEVRGSQNHPSDPSC